MVSSMDRNFLLSPINMALLINGTASFTASSMGTGGMFSPPAVMISSEDQRARTHKLTDSKKEGMTLKKRGNETFDPPSDEEESILVLFAQVTRVQPAL